MLIINYHHHIHRIEIAGKLLCFNQDYIWDIGYAYIYEHKALQYLFTWDTSRTTQQHKCKSLQDKKGS